MNAIFYYIYHVRVLYLTPSDEFGRFSHFQDIGRRVRKSTQNAVQFLNPARI